MTRPEPEEQPEKASWLKRVLPVVGAFGVAAVLVLLHIGAYDLLSPFDEAVHFDYVVKASRGEIVTKGDTLGQTAMKEIACRHVDVPDLREPACEAAGSYDPQDFPNRGYNSADIHPPAYYAVTGVVARALVGLGVTDDLFTAARLVGILWLGLGLLMMWFSGKQLDVGDLPLAIVITAVAVTPSLIHSAATVNNDITGLVAGGLLVWATLRWERTRKSSWVLAAATVLALALKTTNIAAVGVCALYLLLRRRGGESREGSNIRGVVVLLGSAAVAMAAWVVVHAVIADPVLTPIDEATLGTGLYLRDVLVHVTSLFTPISYGLPTTLLGGSELLAIPALIAVFMVAAAFAPLLRGAFSERVDRLAASGGLSMLFGGLLFALGSYLFFGEIIVSARYSLSLLPVLTVALAASVRSRSVMWGIAALGAAELALVVGALL